jgi:polysaccharide biosynthesis transport protein
VDFHDYVRTVRRRWPVILLVLLLGIGTGLGLVLLTPPKYEATTRLFVSTQATGTAAEAFQGSSYTAQRIQSYVQVASDPIVLEPVITELGLATTAGQLAGEIQATVVPDTVLIDLDVTDLSPQRAADVANAVAKELQTVVVDRLEAQVGADKSLVNLSIVRPATVPISPSSPSIPLDLGLGALGGLLGGLVVAFLWQALDTRIHSEREVRAVTQAPLLAGIIKDSRSAKAPLIVHSDPHSPRAEAIRSLRTNLQYVDFESSKRIVVVTSSVPTEGKSTVAANTAIALAELGRSTVLVDADLRRARIAGYMGIEGGVGLSNALIGEVPLDDALQEWGTSGRLHVLPAGRVPPNPSELVGSERMERLLRRLEQDFRYVIVDAPPLLPVTDGAALSRMADGAVVVVRAGRTRVDQLRQALESLANVDAKVLGVVLNMLSPRGPDSYGAYGSYYYEEA